MEYLAFALLVTLTVEGRLLYKCNYITYKAVLDTHDQIGCKFAVLHEIHSVSVCALECQQRHCIYFIINLHKECVICEKETGYRSLENIEDFGITPQSAVYINDLGKFVETIHMCVKR